MIKILLPIYILMSLALASAQDIIVSISPALLKISSSKEGPPLKSGPIELGLINKDGYTQTFDIVGAAFNLPEKNVTLDKQVYYGLKITFTVIKDEAGSYVLTRIINSVPPLELWELGSRYEELKMDDFTAIAVVIDLQKVSFNKNDTFVRDFSIDGDKYNPRLHIPKMALTYRISEIKPN